MLTRIIFQVYIIAIVVVYSTFICVYYNRIYPYYGYVLINKKTTSDEDNYRYLFTIRKNGENMDFWVNQSTYNRCKLGDTLIKNEND